MNDAITALKDEWPRICEEGKELVSQMHAHYAEYLDVKDEMEDILYKKDCDYDTEDILSGWIKSHWRNDDTEKYNSQREAKLDKKINTLIDEGMAKPLSPAEQADTERSTYYTISKLPEGMRKLLNLSGTNIQLSEVSRMEYLSRGGMVSTGGTQGSYRTINGRIHVAREASLSPHTLTEELTHYVDDTLGFSDRLAFKRAMNKDYEALKKTGDEFMMDFVFEYRQKADLFDDDSPYPKSHRASELLANIAVGDIFPPDNHTQSEFRDYMQQYMPRSYAQYEQFKEEITKAADQLERGEIVRNRRGMGHD